MANKKQNTNEAIEEIATEVVEATVEAEQHTEPAPKCACVYCGPTIPGVAHRFTVFSGGILPEALQEFVTKHPAARGLIADIDKLTEMRLKVETPGTAENILYKQIKSNL